MIDRARDDSRAVGRRSTSCRASAARTANGASPSRRGVATRDLPQLPDPADREIVPLLLGASRHATAALHRRSGRASFRLAGPLLDRVLPLIAQSGRALLRDPAVADRRARAARLGRRPAVGVPSGDRPRGARRERFDRRRARARRRAAADSRALDGPAERLSRSRRPRRAARRARRLHAGWRSCAASGTDVDSSRRDRPAGRRARAFRRRSRRICRRSCSSRSSPSRRGRSSASAPTHRGVAAVAAGDRDVRLRRHDRRSRRRAATTSIAIAGRLVRRDSRVRAARRSTRLTQTGFARHWDYGYAQHALRNSRRRSCRAPSARSSPTAGASKRKGARSGRRSRCARRCDRASTGSSCTATVDFGDGLTARCRACSRRCARARRPSRWTTAARGWCRRSGCAASPASPALGEASGRSRPLQDVAGGAARRALAAAAGGARRRAVRCARATSWRRSAAPRAARCRRSRSSAAARLPARRARLVRVPAPLRLRRLPRRRHGARQDRHGAGLARSAARDARSEGRRRWSSSPRSVVFNWIEEAARFAPELNVLDFSGARALGRTRRRTTTSC